VADEPTSLATLSTAEVSDTEPLPAGARMLLGEFDDMPMSGWARYRPGGKWHQILDSDSLVRFPCMSTVVPLRTVEWHDYRAHQPTNWDVCRRSHCQRTVEP
jgi:hypothetical protein